MRNHVLLPIMIAVVALSVLSCSQGWGDPTAPVVDSTSPSYAGGAAREGSAKHLWGYWEIGIDPLTGGVEIIPLRGVEFTCNVTVFLQPPAGRTSNLGIKIVDLSRFYDQGLVDVEVSLHHPFPGLVMYTGFDVLGVFVHDGDTFSAYDGNIFYARTDEVGLLLNADGYTRWYNPVEFTGSGLLGFVEGALGSRGMNFTGTINAYKYFCDGLDTDDKLTDFLHVPGNVEDRGAFRSTSSNTRLYRLQFPFLGADPVLTFQYAVVASWEPPDVDPPLNIPDDFPLSANAREPFNLSVADNGSTLWYSGGVGGGTVRIRAELFDWCAAVSPEGILGEFSQIIIESPDCDLPPPGYAVLTSGMLAPHLLPGTAISSVVEIELAGVEPDGPDDVDFLVTVESKAGDTYEQGFGVPVPDAPLASYWRFSLPVGEDPCGNFSVTGADPASAQSGESYSPFIVYGENFQDGGNLAVDIVDGVDVVAGATSVVWVDSSTLTCDFDFCGVNPGDYDLRVTNGCEPVSCASMAYTVTPDPLKNIELRGGVQIADLGICEETGEPYVQFTDGQL